MDELFMFPFARFAFLAVNRLKNQFVYIETHTARAFVSRSEPFPYQKTGMKPERRKK